MRTWVQSLAFLSGSRVWHCHELCGGHRCRSDPEFLCLMCRQAAAAPIQLLALEFLYVISEALKRQKKKKLHILYLQLSHLFQQSCRSFSISINSYFLSFLSSLFELYEYGVPLNLKIFFLSFEGCTHDKWRIPGSGSNWSCCRQPTSEPQKHQIWAMSATYTTAHSNAGSLNHWARPGIKPTTSWFPVRFVFCCATMGTPKSL